jgi:hypothetical protein
MSKGRSFRVGGLQLYLPLKSPSPSPAPASAPLPLEAPSELKNSRFVPAFAPTCKSPDSLTGCSASDSDSPPSRSTALLLPAAGFRPLPTPCLLAFLGCSPRSSSLSLFIALSGHFSSSSTGLNVYLRTPSSIFGSIFGLLSKVFRKTKALQ